MDKFGIIGSPVKGSRSPQLFNAAYDGKYSYDLIEGSDFLQSWKTFLEEYKAINVTAPFKEDAFAQVLALAREGLAEISGPCFKIKATNLVVKGEKGLSAHNSDFSGIILSVAEAYFPGLVAQCYDLYGGRGHVKVHQFIKQNIEEVFGQRPQALVIGTGGAGKAAAVAAAEMGFATALMNRTSEKAAAICRDLPEYGFIPVPFSDFKGAVRECDLVIYTLPVAVDAINGLEAADFAGEGSRPKVLLEANYKTPAFSGDVMNRLQAGGCHYVHGSNWLLYQALAGYGLMTGETPLFSRMQQLI